MSINNTTIIYIIDCLKKVKENKAITKLEKQDLINYLCKISILSDSISDIKEGKTEFK